jgi:integrase
MRGRNPKGATLEEAMQSYIAACRVEGNVADWLDQQEKHIAAFIAFHDSRLQSLEKAEAFHLTAFLAYCQRDRGNSSSTLCRKAVVIRSWARWCRKSGLVKSCPLADAEIPKERPTPIEVASMAVYLAKIEELHPDWSDEFRVYLGSGLRRGELLHLRWKDIDLETSIVYVRNRKGWSPKARKDRVVALTEDAQAALSRIVARREWPGMQGPYLDEEGRLLLYPTTLSHAWLEFTREAGLPPRLHATRHAHATAAVDDGAYLTDVQAQLGHSSIRTTQRYVRPNPAGPLRMVRVMDKHVS